MKCLNKVLLVSMQSGSSHQSANGSANLGIVCTVSHAALQARFNRQHLAPCASDIRADLVDVQVSTFILSVRVSK